MSTADDRWGRRPEMHPVASSNVVSVGYDPRASELWVRFVLPGDTTYVYEGVDEEVFTRFLVAPSKGSYVHQHLRDRYPTRIVPDSEGER